MTLPAIITNLTKPTRYIDAAECAKLIRAALKEAFPAVRFSVRLHRYSGGSSINVGWVDGPRQDQVEPITRSFQGADFDGMQDLRLSRRHTLNGEPVCFCVSYVFCRRDYSPAARAAMAAAVAKLSDDELGCVLARLSMRAWSDYDRSADREAAARVLLAAMPAGPAPTSRLADSVTLLSVS